MEAEFEGAPLPYVSGQTLNRGTAGNINVQWTRVSGSEDAIRIRRLFVQNKTGDYVLLTFNKGAGSVSTSLWHVRLDDGESFSASDLAIDDVDIYFNDAAGAVIQGASQDFSIQAWGVPST